MLVLQTDYQLKSNIPEQVLQDAGEVHSHNFTQCRRPWFLFIYWVLL